MQTSMNRRDLLIGGGALAAAATAASTANAADPMAGHGGHGGHVMGSQKNQAVIDAAMDCLEKANVCLDHCFILFQANDTSVANCARTVSQMLPMCDVLAKYAISDSAYLKKVAQLCIDTCSDCEKECRKHENKHPQCKACADSCAACIKVCKKLIAA